MRSYRPERAVRRRRPACVAGAPRAGARGRPPDERQPARQRRAAPPAAASCPTSASHAVEVTEPGGVDPRGHPGARAVPRRRGPRQRRQLPDLRARRDRLQPARRGLRGHRQGLRRRDPGQSTSTSRAPGRVVEMLSEHTCQGWLEGYLLTGRHGLFSCYEAFIHLVDSMLNQHAKWLKTTRGIEWRPPIASLNYLLTSHVWRQDHNGFSHQDPGFIDHVVNKKAEVVRVYLPPDTNTLLSTMRHCLASEHYVNVVVAGKQPTFDWLDAEARGPALRPRRSGSGTGPPTTSGEPDVVLACAGDVPTLEALAATVAPARAPARAEGPLRQRRRPDAAAGRHGAPARADRPRLRHRLHHRPAGGLRLPRLPVADPPADLPPHQPRTTCTCAATRRRAPPPRRSTW